MKTKRITIILTQYDDRATHKKLLKAMGELPAFPGYVGSVRRIEKLNNKAYQDLKKIVAERGL